MNEIFTEKYRPKKLEDLALNASVFDTIKSLIASPSNIQSLVFYSSQPGTGKTSTARVIAKELGADLLEMNASMDRGIDFVRERINQFARSLSSKEGIKRLVFMDEADGISRPAQDSLRNLMETCSSNCFFILSCNDISKIIEPLQSRCTILNFENPDRMKVISYVDSISYKEKINISDVDLNNLVELYYPDIRRMVLALQNYALDNTSFIDNTSEFNNFLLLMKTKDINKIQEIVYEKSINLSDLNRYIFRKLFENASKYTPQKLSKIAEKLADSEKYMNNGCNKEIVFLSNILAILAEN